MNWYVKYNGTGEISGPTSQEIALSMAEQFDGMAFSEQIFSPRFVMPEEVEEIINHLRKYRCDSSADMLQRAIDTITLLCREKAPVTSQEVEELLHELKSLRTSMEIVRNGEDDAIGLLCGRISDALVSQVSAIPKDFEVIIRELRALGSRDDDCRDCGGFDEDDRNTCEKAADALIQLSREKKVTGIIVGGHLILDEDDLPEGVSVDIRNYDVHGSEENLETDDSGRAYSHLRGV